MSSEALLAVLVRDKVKLFARLPTHLSLFSVSWFDLYPEHEQVAHGMPRNTLRPQAFRWSGAEFLELSSAACNALVSCGVASQSVFEYAVESLGSDQISLVAAPLPENWTGSKVHLSMDRLARRFATFSRAFQPDDKDRTALRTPALVEVSIETVYASRFSLDRLRKAVGSSAFEPEHDLPLPDGDYISRHLKKLWQVLMDQSKALVHESYDNARKLEMPSRDKLFRRLDSECAFESSNKASGAAAALCLSSVERDSTGQWHLHAPGLLALVSCATHFWRNYRPGDLPPKLDEMKTYLRGKTGLGERDLQRCVALIRPEFAPKGRTPG
jgi:hypothetical protein